MQFFTKKHRGFTLIELLVVIAIIGILATIVLVSMTGVQKSGRDTARKVDMRQITSAQQMFYSENDRYYTCSDTGGDCGGEGWPSSIGTYMRQTPSDPGTGTYVWIDNTADSQRFCAYATLEGPSVTTYYTASDAGTFETTVTPTLTACGY
jgi:prepilin-type N-terminal cleavage/methylation domain-containing protein